MMNPPLIILKQWYVIRESKAMHNPIVYGGFKTSLEAEIHADQSQRDKIISITDNHLSQYILTNGDWRNIMPPKNQP